MSQDSTLLGLVATASALVFLGYTTWAWFGRRDAWGRQRIREYERWVDRSLKSLFIRWTPAQYASRHVAVTLLLALLGGLTGGGSMLLLGGAAGAWLGFRWPNSARRTRRRKLEGQIDSTLRSLAQTVRVTPNMVDALETASRQVDPPMREELELAVRQHRLGMTIEDALRELAERAGSRNLDAAVTAIAIGRMTGGNLSEILEETAAVLRERLRLEGVIEAKTAEGKAQASVMGALPLVLGTAVYVVDPDFISPLFLDPIGWVILAVAVAMMVAGVVMVRKISRIEV